MSAIGPTGEFPEGKLSSDDEGELTIAITVWRGQVRLDFGAPTAWLAMPPALALRIGRTLIQRAIEASEHDPS